MGFFFSGRTMVSIFRVTEMKHRFAVLMIACALGIIEVIGVLFAGQKRDQQMGSFNNFFAFLTGNATTYSNG